MTKLFYFFINLIIIYGCHGQGVQSKKSSTHIGGACEGCEAIYEYGNKLLKSADTLPSFFHKGEKLKVTGTIYQKDKKTPAKGIILYIYHTNPEGIYPKAAHAKGWGIRHGMYRGWIKTGGDGRYTFYTIKPGTYPSRRDPAHIHATVKEPHLKEYYISEYYFNDDPLITKEERNNQFPKGGSGIVKLIKENGISVAKRDIILGLNIENYE